MNAPQNSINYRTYPTLLKHDWMSREIAEQGYRLMLLRTQHKTYPYKLLVIYRETFNDCPPRVRAVFPGVSPVDALCKAHQAIVFDLWDVGA